jgi:hypothetical protein
MSVETVIYVYMRGNTYLSHAKGRKRIQKKKKENVDRTYVLNFELYGQRGRQSLN